MKEMNITGNIRKTVKLRSILLLYKGFFGEYFIFGNIRLIKYNGNEVIPQIS